MAKIIVEHKAGEYDSGEVMRMLFGCIDLTTLKATDSQQSVAAFSRAGK